MNGILTLAGNLTRDPEFRVTPTGAALARFSLAVDRRWRSATGQWEERSSYYNVVAWGSLGEHAGRSLHKGDRVVVHGRIEVVTWTPEDQVPRTRVEIVADEIGASLRWATAAITKVERVQRVEESAEGSPSRTGVETRQAVGV